MVRRLLVSAAGVLLLATGCGLPRAGGVQTVDPSAVPYGLLSTSPSDVSQPSGTGQSTTTPRLYFVDQDEQLTPVQVRLDRQGLNVVLQQLLDGLGAGPAEAQRSRGLGSALGPGVTLRLVDVMDGTARIEVDIRSQDPSADRLPLAVGQIVLTATSVAGVDQVQLLRDGRTLEVPLPGGAQTAEPLRPDDYRSLVASPTLSTSKAAADPTAR